MEVFGNKSIFPKCKRSELACQLADNAFVTESYNIDVGAGITVSGLSAGGFMAVQMHVAYSDLFTGVGVIAGGTYSSLFSFYFISILYFYIIYLYITYIDLYLSKNQEKIKTKINFFSISRHIRNQF